jgi:hypothetical protein
MALATVYATDEDVAVRAAGDFAVLTPDWQKLAYALDGSISSWTLTSATTTFSANGVASGHVVSLKKPTASFKGGGELLAIDSASTNSVVMRRIGKAAGVGQTPPAVSSVEFIVATLDPQIEEASFDLNRRFNIDPNNAERQPADLYDLRDLRQACVLTVLCWRYAAETRSDSGDFKMKAAMFKDELSNILSRLSIRWGATADVQPATTAFSTRLSR